MKRKRLDAYLDTLWKPVRHSFKTFVKKKEAEALHQFRVQVKKIKAFIQLTEGIAHPVRLSPFFKPVLKIFRIAGCIRDAQIRLRLGVQQHADEAFKEEQRKIIEENTSLLQEKKKQYLQRMRKSRRKMKRHLAPVKDKNIEQYYRMQLGRIDGCMRQPQAGWHTCRKQIKTLVYDYEWTARVLHIPVNRKYLKRLEQAIGNWHDNLQAARLFPALQAEDSKHRDRIRKIARHFYRRATAAL